MSRDDQVHFHPAPQRRPRHMQAKRLKFFRQLAELNELQAGPLCPSNRNFTTPQEHYNTQRKATHVLPLRHSWRIIRDQSFAP